MSQVLDPPRQPARPPRVDPRLRARRIEVKRSEGRRRLRRLLIAVVVTVVAAGAWGITRSPLLDVDHLEVHGLTRLSPETVVAAGGIETGDALVDLDLGAAADAVGALALVERVEIERSWWGTVRYDVVERRPTAVVSSGGVDLLVDRAGWVLAPAQPADRSLPAIAGIDPVAAGDRLSGVDLVAVQLVDRAPPTLLEWVEVVTVTDGSLWLDLRPQAVTAAGGTPGHSGRVQLGDARELDAQLVAAHTMLARVDLSCLDVIDVRVPASPVVRRVEGCSGGEAA